MHARRRSRRGSRSITALLATLVAIVASLIVAPAASAAPLGWVYISTPTWQGNCNWGSNGSVSHLHLSVGNTWTTPAGGDRGDDLVYAQVRLNENQQVSFTAFCNKWPGSWQPGVGQTIRPTRNGQTVWIGPAGVRYN